MDVKLFWWKCKNLPWPGSRQFVKRCSVRKIFIEFWLFWSVQCRESRSLSRSVSLSRTNLKLFLKFSFSFVVLKWLRKTSSVDCRTSCRQPSVRLLSMRALYPAIYVRCSTPTLKVFHISSREYLSQHAWFGFLSFISLEIVADKFIRSCRAAHQKCRYISMVSCTPNKQLNLRLCWSWTTL